MSDPKPVLPETRLDEAAMTVPDDPEGSVYRFIIVAAKRARQLQTGMRPKIHYPSRKMTRVAIEETRRGVVQWEDPEKAEPVPAEAEEEVVDQ